MSTTMHCLRNPSDDSQLVIDRETGEGEHRKCSTSSSPRVESVLNSPQRKASRRGIGNGPSRECVASSHFFGLCSFFADLVSPRSGATVLSWKVKGQDILFVSKKAIFDNKKAIRGGIPLVFPCFGPWKNGPQHGFARIKGWKKESEAEKVNDRIFVTFSLEDDDETRKMWSYSFKLIYKVDLGENDLKLTLTVNNKDSKPFDFTTLMHTYFGCSNIDDVRIQGLEGLQFNDKVAGSETKEERTVVSIDKNYDRVYMKCDPDKIKVDNVGDGSKSVALSLSNLPDVVVWNPWEEKAKAMSDFDDDEYRTMICVEAGSVTQPITAPAGGSVTFSQTLRLCE